MPSRSIIDDLRRAYDQRDDVTFESTLARLQTHYANEAMWAIGWLSYGGKPFPFVAEAGACKIFATREQAMDSRMDRLQDVAKVRVILEVLKEKKG